jgi:hypothetical protein
MAEEAYQALLATLTMREVSVRVAMAGFRTQVLVVATTLLDAAVMLPSNIAWLCRLRWLTQNLCGRMVYRTMIGSGSQWTVGLCAAWSSFLG